ncbi:hypothetical protein [Rubrivivax rivuli]|uniref:Uncharacterized protein n=1 Tax=Rubrivivax rivuli TaxID=1862385 RepID=A0A437R9K0_9BURK|nr:hypothetical protein [Rubrivivax rivuli]RVU43377.1 hypothetical protein EOE66_20765 [Rubrivivax rivuli]
MQTGARPHAHILLFHKTNMTLSTVRPYRGLTAAVLLAALSVGAVHATSIYKPQDTKGVITSYDLLGVKLGMSEAEAVAAIRKRFPPGSKDANDRPINLKQSDYELTSPATGAKVKAGIRFDLHPETKSNFDFVKIFVFEGKVWAVWRDDASGRYAYEKMVADVQAKYADTAPIKSAFMIVNGGTIAPQQGDPAIHGAELFEGQCLDFPFVRSGSGDKIRLDPACRKAFGVSYQPQHRNGVKILASGFGQLVDLDAGRSFMKYMASGAGNIHGERPKTGDAKL